MTFSIYNRMKCKETELYWVRCSNGVPYTCGMGQFIIISVMKMQNPVLVDQTIQLAFD